MYKRSFICDIIVLRIVICCDAGVAPVSNTSVPFVPKLCYTLYVGRCRHVTDLDLL
jgi:hypothetical protein